MLDDVLHRDAFNHHHQLGPSETEDVLLLIKERTLKLTGLKTLVIDDQTATFPMKDLDRVPPAVHEDEHFSAQWITPHLRADNTR